MKAQNWESDILMACCTCLRDTSWVMPHRPSRQQDFRARHDQAWTCFEVSGDCLGSVNVSLTRSQMESGRGGSAWGAREHICFPFLQVGKSTQFFTLLQAAGATCPSPLLHYPIPRRKGCVDVCFHMCTDTHVNGGSCSFPSGVLPEQPGQVSSLVLKNVQI